jgi:hypothetical protein
MLLPQAIPVLGWVTGEKRWSKWQGPERGIRERAKGHFSKFTWFLSLLKQK